MHKLEFSYREVQCACERNTRMQRKYWASVDGVKSMLRKQLRASGMYMAEQVPREMAWVSAVVLLARGADVLTGAPGMLSFGGYAVA